MSSLVSKMKWEKASFGVDQSSGEKPDLDSLKWNLSNLSCVTAGKKPILLFIESRKVTKSTPKSKPKQALEFKNSLRVDAKVFEDEKYKLPITSGVFRCIRMDVSNVDEKKNKGLHSAEAPIVAVYSKDGVLKEYCSGAGVTLFKVYGMMRKLMRPKDVDLDKMYRQIYERLDSLYKNEVKLYRMKADYKKDLAKYNKLKKKTPTVTARIEKAKKAVGDCQAVSERLKKDCSLFVKYYSLKAQGVNVTLKLK